MWNWLRKLFRRESSGSAAPSTQGTVKRIVRDKGFGFIRSTDGQEVFFHRSALVGLEMRALSEGQRVEFVLEESPKGLRASSVRATREEAGDRKIDSGAGDDSLGRPGGGRAQRRAQSAEDGARAGNAGARQQAGDRDRPPDRQGRRGRHGGGRRGRGER